MRNLIERSLMLIGGAGLGAGIMYVLDPDSGESRRNVIAASAQSAIATGKSALADQLHALGNTAAQLGEQVAQQASTTADAANEYAGSISDYGNQALSQARGYLRRAGALARWQREPRTDYVTIATSVAGALILGAGLMYLLDPEVGRRRRQNIADTASRATNRAKGVIRDTTRKARDLAGQHTAVSRENEGASEV